MPSIKINQEKCLGCKKCLPTCPFGAIEMRGEDSQNRKAHILDNCTLCGICVDACKFEAIELISDKHILVDHSAYEGIWVYAEQSGGRLRQVVFELLNEASRLARELNTEVTCVVLGSGIAETTGELIAAGADRVIIVDQPQLAQLHDLRYTDIIIRLVHKYKPSIFLLGATSFGRSLAPRIAARLRTGLTADCTVLAVDKAKGLLLQTRPAFGGNLMATIICPNHRPQMATVRPKVFTAEEPDHNRRGKIIIEDFTVSSISPVEIIELIRSEGEKVNINNADILISIGKGIGNVKNIALAKELASLLGGALASSRPLVDTGLIGYAHQVGQTGKTVVPKLYIACGISGAIQHMAGVAAETIVAVNSDPDAPIFNYAHYAIHGDCIEFLEEMISCLKGRG